MRNGFYFEIENIRNQHVDQTPLRTCCILLASSVLLYVSARRRKCGTPRGTHTRCTRWPCPIRGEAIRFGRPKREMGRISPGVGRSLSAVQLLLYYLLTMNGTIRKQRIILKVIQFFYMKLRWIITCSADKGCSKICNFSSF